MAKYYLYILLAIFILLNGVEYFEQELKNTIKQHSLLTYKLGKQELYASHSKEVEAILAEQKITIEKNSKLFFKKEKKETIVFSEIQSYIQLVSKSVGGKISQLHSGTIIDSLIYKKYPISLNIKLIPEDLDIFFKKLYSSKKYLFIDSLYVVANKRERILLLKITLSGYQIK